MLSVPRLLRRTTPVIVGHHWFRAPAVLERRHVSTPLKKNQAVDASTVRPQITPALLLYTITLAQASRLPRPLVKSSVIALLDNLYSRPDERLAARARELPTGLVRQINSTYDTMDAMASGFAACALKRISPGVSRAISTSVSLSPSEHFRFCRAFYRVELYYTLFHWRGAFAAHVNRVLFSRHPPWENEQLACVYGYLRTRLDQALAERHADGFEEHKQDKGEDRGLRPSELSRGVKFIHRLANAPSPKAQRRILDTNIYNGAKHLYERCESVTLHQYGQPNDEDADAGPYQLWRTENARYNVAESFLLSNDWLRDCAYVFWDGDRVRKMGGFRKCHVSRKTMAPGKRLA